jgi:hypothetical protein
MKNALLSCIAGSLLLCVQVTYAAGQHDAAPVGVTTTITYTITACIDDHETLWVVGDTLQWAVYSGSRIGEGLADAVAHHDHPNEYDCRTPGNNDISIIRIQKVVTDPTPENESSDVTYPWKPTYNNGLQPFDTTGIAASDFEKIDLGLPASSDQSTVTYAIQELTDRGPVKMWCPSKAKSCTVMPPGGKDPQGGTAAAAPNPTRTKTDQDLLHFDFQDAPTGAVVYKIVVTATITG